MPGCSGNGGVFGRHRPVRMTAASFGSARLQPGELRIRRFPPTFALLLPPDSSLAPVPTLADARATEVSPAALPPPPAPQVKLAAVIAQVPDLPPPPPPPAPAPLKPKVVAKVAAKVPKETFCDAGGGASTYHVVLDSIKSRDETGPMIAYGVCGLKAGSHYHTVITATRQESGLSKLLGTTHQTTEEYDDRASSNAAHMHHRLPRLSRGSYSLRVTVTDRRGRRSEQTAAFRLPAQ